MDDPVTFAFSTGVALDDCGVTGRVSADGVPVAEATVWACSASPAPDSLGVFRRCGRTATSGPDGAFTLGFLSPERSPYSIIAFLDADGDGAYSPAEEAGVMEANAAVFAAAGDTTRGIDLTLEPPASSETSGSGEPLLEEEEEQE